MGSAQLQLRTPDDPHALLRELDAPERLLKHARLVGEAAEALIALLSRMGVGFDARLVRLATALHDAGKILHPAELDGPGTLHEPAGEQLLLEHGVEPRVARCCRTHAQWAKMACTLEEQLVALADKLWKDACVPQLEEKVIEQMAAQLRTGRWDIFVELDTAFEKIAADGAHRLVRSG